MPNSVPLPHMRYLASASQQVPRTLERNGASGWKITQQVRTYRLLVEQERVLRRGTRMPHLP